MLVRQLKFLQNICFILVNCQENRGGSSTKRKLLERDDNKMVCYLVKRFPSSRKSYERSKDFCHGKGGILVEVRGRKDQSNVREMLRQIGDEDRV